MDRGEKSRGEEAEKEGTLGEKLRRGVLISKRGGSSTPLRILSTTSNPSSSSAQISARKLAAAVYELNQYLPWSKTHGASVTNGLSGSHRLEDKDAASGGGGREISHFLADPCPSSTDQITPYDAAVFPSRSLDFKGRGLKDLKTSSQNLDVLNRIRSLEEQHLSNVSLVRALKIELQHACARTKELLRDRQSNQREIKALMKQIGERKLREISDAETSLSNAVRELENERKSRKLLEDLSDEFAVGIRDYEHELHSLKKKYDEEWNGESSEHGHLILHVAESWLDERMQVKTIEGSHGGFAEKTSVVEKLRFELEMFLQGKKGKGTDRRLENILPKGRRISLESAPLNEAMPRDFELKRRRKPRDPSRMQVKFEEQMARAILSSRNKDSSQAMKNTEKDETEVECGEASCSNSAWRSRANPVRPWMAKLSSPRVHIDQSSTKLPHALTRQSSRRRGQTRGGTSEGFL